MEKIKQLLEDYYRLNLCCIYTKEPHPVWLQMLIILMTIAIFAAVLTGVLIFLAMVAMVFMTHPVVALILLGVMCFWAVALAHINDRMNK